MAEDIHVDETIYLPHISQRESKTWLDIELQWFGAFMTVSVHTLKFCPSSTGLVQEWQVTPTTRTLFSFSRRFPISPFLMLLSSSSSPCTKNINYFRSKTWWSKEAVTNQRRDRIIPENILRSNFDGSADNAYQSSTTACSFYELLKLLNCLTIIIIIVPCEMHRVPTDKNQVLVGSTQKLVSYLNHLRLKKLNHHLFMGQTGRL